MARARAKSPESTTASSEQDTGETSASTSSASTTQGQGPLRASGPSVSLGGVQAKPVLSTPGDRYEQEANAFATSVTGRGPAPALSRVRAGDLGGAQRQTDEEEPVQAQVGSTEEEEEPVQTQPEEGPLQKEARASGGQRGIGGRSKRDVAAHTIRASGPGRPMHRGTRRTIERRGGVDLRGVRVHDGPRAQSAARTLQARAFTHGRNIWLGADASDRDLSLMAHEAAHVVQQGATAQDAMQRQVGSKEENEEEPVQVQVSEEETPVQRQSEDEGVLGTIASLGSSAFWSTLGTVLPGKVIGFLKEVQQNGILGTLKGRIEDAISGLFAALGAQNPALTSIVGSLIERFSPLLERVNTIVQGLAAGSCDALFQAIADLKVVLSTLASDAWDHIVEFLEPVSTFLENTWDRFGSPLLEWIQSVSGEVWQGIQTVWSNVKYYGSQLASAASQLGSTVWGKVKGLLGFTGGASKEAGAGSGVMDWIKDKANAAWSTVTAPLNRALAPVRQVVSKVKTILPLDAVKRMQERVQSFQSQVAQMDAAADSADGLVKNRTRLREAILPGILGAIDTVRGAVGTAQSWLVSTIKGLTGPIETFFATIGEIDLLSGVTGALGWVKSGVLRLKEWVTSTVGTVFDALDAGLQQLKAFARPVYRVLTKIVGVLTNFVGGIKSLISSVWTEIPACLRDTIEDFLVNKILANVPFFNALTTVKGVWEKIVNTAYTALAQVFVDGDLLGAAWTVFRALLNALGIPEDLVVSLVNNALKAFHLVFKDPVGFLGNVVQSMQLGLKNFINAFGTHVLGGLQDWVFGALQANGIEPPSTFSFQEVFRFLTDLFDITLDSILDKVAKHLGVERALIDRVIHRIQAVVSVVGRGLEWVRTLSEKGVSALWTWLQDKIMGLWGAVRDQLVQYMSIQVVQKAVAKLALAVTPTGVSQVVAIVESIWSAIQAAAEYATRMIKVVNSALDSVVTIAQGTLEPAAARVENTLSQSIPVAIGVLAHQVGLGDLPTRFGSIIKKVRGLVDEGLDKLIGATAGLLTSAVETVKGGFSAVKEKLMQWWRQSASFTRDGESHEVGFEGTKENARLTISSTPTPVQALLSQERTRIDALDDEKKKEEQRQILTRIEAEVATVQRIKTKDGTRDQSDFGKADGEKIKESLSRLADFIGDLDGERKVPPSQIVLETKTQDIPIAHTDRTESSTDARLMNAEVLSLKSNEYSGGRPTQWSTLAKEVNKRSGKYVRGHLLNHHVHGPGTTENLTPITRSLNSTMESVVESDVKKKVLDENKVVHYRVEAVYDGRNGPERKYLPAENYMPTALHFTLKELYREEGTDGSKAEDWQGNVKDTKPIKPLKNELPPDTNPFTENVFKSVNLKRLDVTDPKGKAVDGARSLVADRLGKIPGIGDKKAQALLDIDAWDNWDDLTTLTDKAGRALFSEDDVKRVREELAPGTGDPLFHIEPDAETVYEPLGDGA